MPLPWKSRAQLLESSRREQERLNMQRRADAAAKLREIKYISDAPVTENDRRRAAELIRDLGIGDRDDEDVRGS